MIENRILISGSYNAFKEGWNGGGVYMCSGLYKSDTFKYPIYIGSSDDMRYRIEYRHICSLERNTHINPVFQNAWNNHDNKEGFVWWLLETCLKEETLICEQKYLDLYRPFVDEFGGYNLSHIAGAPMKGRKHSEETRRKISKAGRGRKMSQKCKDMMIKIHKGKIVSQATREKQSETRKRKMASGEIINHQLGKPLPIVQRKKIGMANSKRVLCIETNISYNSAKEASLAIGLEKSAISACCMGKTKTAARFHWKYI